jgi:hypothetical protein
LSTLEKLQNAKSLTDLAKLLGFTPKGASCVLYKLPTAQKYRTFEIPKKSGGMRTINAPEKLLSLLQKRLSKLLYECVTEHQKKPPEILACITWISERPHYYLKCGGASSASIYLQCGYREFLWYVELWTSAWLFYSRQSIHP